MEYSIDVLANLTGPTLADGLTAPGTADFAADVIIRGDIASCLPTATQRLETCLSQFRKACDQDATALVELLRKARIRRSAAKTIPGAS